MSDLPPGPTDCPKPEPTVAPNGAADCCDMMLGGQPVSEDNPVPVDVTLVAPAIELGSVTIRDFDSATEANVNAGHELSVADVDTHTALGTANATLTAIAGSVDGLEAEVAAGNVLLGNIAAGIPDALGAATIAGSMPVNIASDQIVPVSLAGSATAANQALEIAGLSSIDGHVDGLEGLVTAGNATLTAIDGHVDGLEGLITAGNATLVAIDGHVDGLETLVTAGNASLVSIDAGTPAALGQAAMAASMPVVIANNQTAVPGNITQVAGTALDVNAGNASAGTQRVVVVSDQAAIKVGGQAADNAASVGNPILAGAKVFTAAQVYADGDVADLEADTAGNLRVTQNTLISGEDQANDLIKVENRYTYARQTADAQIKASAGFVHTVTIAPTGVITAGVFTLYDSTTEAGTAIFSMNVPVGYTGGTFLLDEIALTGLYGGYDATLVNVQVNVSFR